MIIKIHAQASDINAKGAFDKTALSPERREKHAISSYLDHMAETGSEFSDYATAENYTNLCRELEAYRIMYAQRLNAYLEAKRGAASALIAGAHAITDETIANGAKARQLRHDLDIWQHSALDFLRNLYMPKNEKVTQ